VYRFLGRRDRDIVNALNMSVYTGRAEQYLVFDRLDLALNYTSVFGNDERALIRDQIQLAWRINPARLLKRTRDGVFSQSTLLGLISDSNPELAEEIKAQL